MTLDELLDELETSLRLFDREVIIEGNAGKTYKIIGVTDHDDRTPVIISIEE